MIYWALASAVASISLGWWAFSFKVDAAPVGSMIFLAALGVAVVSIFLFGIALGRATAAERVRCTFDRNEPRKGEVGDGLDGKPVNGWWWDIYKCSDGTERRVLVAGPRG